MKLISLNTSGNVHESCAQLNKMGVADYVISLDFNGGHNSIAVLKVPDCEVGYVWNMLGYKPENCPAKEQS